MEPTSRADHEIEHGRFLAEASGHQLRPVTRAGGCLLVEELHRNAQHLRQIEQSAGANTIDALLVFLDLLERQAELLAELLLAHAKQHTTEPHAASDMDVDRIWSA